MGKMTIAVDFDGTLTLDPHAYPHAGEPNWPVINKVKKLKEEGWDLILWTCRSGESLKIAVEATKSWGIKWDAVNEPTEYQKTWWKGDHGPKIFANYYLDDRNVYIEDFLK